MYDTNDVSMYGTAVYLKCINCMYGCVFKVYKLYGCVFKVYILYGCVFKVCILYGCVFKVYILYSCFLKCKLTMDVGGYDCVLCSLPC